MEFPRNENIDDLKVKKTLDFQITDWFVPESDKNREKNEDPELYSILLYGTTEEGITICSKIVGFQPYFYVKPPDSWSSLSDTNFERKVQDLYQSMIDGKYECYFKNKDTGVSNTYNKKIIPKDFDSHFNGLSTFKSKDFWGFTNNSIFRYIKVSVKSLALYNNLKYYFTSLKKEGFQLYESNIDPFLRYIHVQNIKPCGWVSISKYTIIDNDTRCNYNIQVKWNNVNPIDVNKIAPLLIASFDIECTSSHGDFPVAKKDYKKLAQDLAYIAKAGYECSEDYLKIWISNAFKDDVIIEHLKINRLYPKRKVLSSNIISKLEPKLNKIIDLLDKISNLDDDDDENEEDDDDKKKPSLSIREQNELETELNNILTKILPELEGDKVIQIGTTVHKYGSDTIIYKNIISLNTCDDIENCDVVVCKTEKDLIMSWKDLIMRLNPDVLIGYNIFGFDMEYIWVRACENNAIDDFSIGLGRTLNRKVSLVKQQLASAAMGENILKYFDMDGTVIIDLFKVMQREQKLDSYKLDNVATIFLGDKKDDLKPHEIFEKFKGNSQDRCVIAKYCIQDCALVNRLLHKLKLIENNVGMGNVCLVPLNFLFRRGQGIKIFSLIAKQCMDKGFLIPVIRSFDSEYDIDFEGYEGAVVLDPKEGIYLNDPIVVFDYGSLYPSSMIARNLSHDTYIIDKKYMVEDPNVEYITVSYDLYEGLGDKKKKTGVKNCIFAQYKDGKKGIIAEILNMLLLERKNTRKKIEYKTAVLNNGNNVSGYAIEKDDEYEFINIDTNEKTIIKKDIIVSIDDTYNNFEQDVFDALQLAYKITANSLYGQIGARTSPIYLKEIAACTTATGREMIMVAKEFVETKYDAEVIYGDSVMPYTPITYKIDDNINVSTFEKLEGEWFEYNNFKPNDTDRFEKEQFIPDNMQVWTHKGWSKIKRVIRHKTTKKIYRVLTHTGLVDVTEDHSLLDINCNIIKPNDCKIGTELLHSKPIIELNNNDYEQSYNKTEGTIGISIKHQVLIQKHFMILQSLNYNVHISFQGKLVILNYSLDKKVSDTDDIKSINVIHESYTGYVYDIETEEGVFHGGIGNIILKNTDSIFCKFPLKDSAGNRVYGKDALTYAIKVGKEVEKDIAKIMPSPQKLNYEKSLYPFIIFSKKRYVGNLYENDVNKFKQKSMGIVLKRRDNAQIVKKIYGGIIDILLNKQDLNLSLEFLKEELYDLVDGKTPITELIISKSLRGSYKDPSKIAHKVLADRIGSRDPGNKPAINDRVPYVYIKVPDAKLQGDRIENPDYIVQNSITPDYLHYITNQIMKPIIQLYALCLDQLPNYDKDINYWKELEKELRLKPIYEDDKKRKNRLDNLKLNMVKELLFDEFIYILSEPKKKKEKKEPVKKKKEVIAICDEDDNRNIIITPNIITNTNTNNDIHNASIKVIKNSKTNIINSVAKIVNSDNKTIWNYKNDNCKSKDVEYRLIIHKMLIENKDIFIKITLNCKPFIKDYKIALAKYKEFEKNTKIGDNLVKNALLTNDVGIMSDVNSIVLFKTILELNNRFTLE